MLKIILKVCFTNCVWGSDADKKIDMMFLSALVAAHWKEFDFVFLGSDENKCKRPGCFE